MKSFFAIALLVFSFISSAQQMHLFRTVYFPAEPNGGLNELKQFVKQELFYPREALEKGIEGDVFITFKINSKGEISHSLIADNTDTLLQKEAMRVFERIIWEKDPGRDDEELGFEKIKISFDIKKYRKLVKKRGYDSLPYPNQSITISADAKVFDINHVDTKPIFDMTLDHRAFLKENFKYPEIALKQNISGRVTVEFIVEPYGRASNIRVIEPVGGGCNQETKRLVRLMRWKPAIKNEKAVRCKLEYQLNFVNPGGAIR